MSEIFYSAKLMNRDRTYTQVSGVKVTETTGRDLYDECVYHISTLAEKNNIKYEKIILVSLNKI